jgi:hypothetical protein
MNFLRRKCLPLRLTSRLSAFGGINPVSLTVLTNAFG